MVRGEMEGGADTNIALGSARCFVTLEQHLHVPNLEPLCRS